MKRHKISILALLLSICCFASTACSLNNVQSNSIGNSDSPTSADNLSSLTSTDNSSTLSYLEYLKLYFQVRDSLDVSGYVLKDSTQDTHIIGIDLPLSFYKRDVLTTTGESNGYDTQKTMLFENANKKSIVMIDIIFTDTVLGNDMAYVQSATEWNVDNKELLGLYNEILLTYKNTILKLTLLSETDGEHKDLFDFNEQIVEMLEPQIPNS